MKINHQVNISMKGQVLKQNKILSAYFSFSIMEEMKGRVGGWGGGGGGLKVNKGFVGVQ